MKTITVQGKQYPSIIAACKALGASKATVSHRVNKLGMSYEEALTTTSINAIYSKDHLGKEYPTFLAMCTAWHIGRDAVSYRLNKGWSLEKALTTKSQRNPNR